MTKKLITHQALFLLVALTISGASTVQASEVTGTLSSNASNVTQTSGNLSGTVSNNSGGGGGGSRRSNRNNGGSSNNPQGSVLGASTNNTNTPGFPNAGVAPQEISSAVTPWSAVIAFFMSIFSF